jgi:hypothetical protein
MGDYGQRQINKASGEGVKLRNRRASILKVNSNMKKANIINGIDTLIQAIDNLSLNSYIIKQ